MLYQQTTDKILCAFYRVYNTLGFGFLENVYQNALCIELEKLGLKALPLQKIPVYYEGYLVGQYVADIVVNEQVILELKAADGLRAEHVAQIMNYLKATQIEVGLLLNFGKKPEFKRLFIENDKKLNVVCT